MGEEVRSTERLFAGALWPEYKAGTRLGEAIEVGVRCRRQKVLPRPVVSFGFAGALRRGFFPGAVVVATKVVDKNGNPIGTCKPLKVRGAVEVVVVGVDHFIASKEEREWLCRESGADVADMESDIYAQANMLDGYLRVISDTPEHPIAAFNFFKTIKNGSKAMERLWSLSIED